MEKKWIVQKSLGKEEIHSLSQKWSISPLMVQLLHNRGVREEIRKFLYPCREDLYNPFLMKGMEEAIQVILRTIHKQKKILIYGDYDVDGITATSLLLLFLREIKANVYFYIPKRESEGYGLNKEAIDKALQKKISLIITCDCGISSFKEVEYAKSKGLEIIITDHHFPEDPLPSCIILDPEQSDCPYPFKKLAGVGVAFKLIQGLSERFSYKKIEVTKYLDLVAIGTIADIVPLKDENRTLVKLGLECLRKTNNVGLKALINVSSLSGKKIGEREIGFILAPRINACGRLSLAVKGVRLLLSTSFGEAHKLAQELNKENISRQRLQEEICREAEEILPKEKDPIILLYKKGWHPGVIGLVASYIKEKYFRPTFIFSLDGKNARGSARSIPSFSVFDALKECEDLLISFGGHKMAAGMEVSLENIEKLRERLNYIAYKSLSPSDFIPSLLIDTRINLEELEEKIFEELELLSPYGSENPLPLFLTTDLSISSFREVRKGYMKISLCSPGGKRFEGIGFNLKSDEIKAPNRVDIIFSPQINYQGGRKLYQLNIKDYRERN